MTLPHSALPERHEPDDGSAFATEAERRSQPGRRLRDKLVEHALTRACVGMAIVDPAGRLIDANLALSTMLGYQPAELAGIDFGTLIHGADKERLQHLLVAVSTAALEDASAEIRYLGRHDTVLWARTSLARFTPTAEQDGLLLVVENIDRLKLAEERLELAMDAADLGVFEWNLETDAMISENQRVREILGYREGQHLRLISEIVLADDSLAFQEALQSALQQPALRFHHVCRIRTHTAASLKWVEFVGQIRREPAAGPARVVGILTDVTTRRMAELALLEADSRKNQFLTMLAHELRNPLAPIKAASLLVQRLTPDLESRVQSAAQMIERQSNHLSKLVEQLLEVTRISTGNIDLSRQVVDFSSLLTDAVESMTLLLDTRRQSLTFKLPPGPIWIDVDTVRITQVLTNLIDNASKYTLDGGHIAVTASLIDGHCEVCVADNGQGVPPELLPHIFEPFIQGKVSAARTNAGLGIGLSIVQQLVTLHGGRVRGESAGSGNGSRFLVTLPLALAPAMAASEPAFVEARPALSGIAAGVLIVDDNADAAESLAELLTLAGCTVRTAGTAAQAFETLDAWQPAVIVLDIGLPDLDGFEVAVQLRARPQTREVLIIALSGYGSADHLSRARAVGIDVYLTKPAQMDHLISAIQDRQRLLQAASQ